MGPVAMAGEVEGGFHLHALPLCILHVQELQRFTLVPWPQGVGLSPKRIHGVAVGHWLCLHLGRFSGRVKVLNFAHDIWMVTSEVVHVLQAVCLQDGHRDALRSSSLSHSWCHDLLGSTDAARWSCICGAEL